MEDIGVPSALTFPISSPLLFHPVESAPQCPSLCHFLPLSFAVFRLTSLSPSPVFLLPSVVCQSSPSFVWGVASVGRVPSPPLPLRPHRRGGGRWSLHLPATAQAKGSQQRTEEGEEEEEKAE